MYCSFSLRRNRDVGKSKSEVAAAAVKEMNTALNVRALQVC